MERPETTNSFELYAHLNVTVEDQAVAREINYGPNLSNRESIIKPKVRFLSDGQADLIDLVLINKSFSPDAKYTLTFVDLYDGPDNPHEYFYSIGCFKSLTVARKHTDRSLSKEPAEMSEYESVRLKAFITTVLPDMLSGKLGSRKKIILDDLGY